MDSPRRPSLLRALWDVLQAYLPQFPARLVNPRFLPSPGNALFTILIVLGLFWAQGNGALSFGAPAAQASSTGTIAYQGRLADADGNPLTVMIPIVFRLYNATSGGSPLWEESWAGANSVRVSDGLFNVMLGSLVPIPQTIVTANSTLWLGITVNADDEMQPRVQLGTVPFAVQALTVPDGSITAAKLADGSVTAAKLAPDSVSAALPVYSVGMPVEIWPIPACDGVTRSVPGLQLSVVVSKPSVLDISFSGLARNTKPGSATLTTIAIDGAEVKTTAGHPILGGFRNGSTDAIVYGNASVHVTSEVGAGTRTVELRANCDGGATDANIGYGWLSVRVFPK